MKEKFDRKLLFMTVSRYLMGLLLVGIVIFLPAGSFKFWNGWLFIGALFIPMLFALVYLYTRDPGLLRKRMKTDEKEKPQKFYLVFSIAAFIITFALPGFDYRFHWSDVPLWLVLLSTGLMISGYAMFFMVMRQNSYASRVVEIQDDQKLIQTGLYSVVRHPMYLAATILYGFSPLVMGSYYAMIPMVITPVLLIIRIKNEEKVLLKGLNGYGSYMEKVRYRLFPYIW